MGRLTDNNGNAIGLRWTLADLGMDLMERAGLAALYMTLRAAEEQAGDDKADAVRDILEWDLSPDSVELRWGDPKAAKPALEALFAFAWQVRDGVLYLPAVHRDDRQRDTYFLRLAEHNGILNTFFQHDKTQSRGKAESRIEAIDEDKEVLFKFQSLVGQTLVPHKTSTLSALAKKKGLKDGQTELSSWIKPGSAPRFSEIEKKWGGTPDQAILLILAPLVCLYQELQGTDRPKSEKTPWVRLKDHLYVCPDVRNLNEFDATRPDVRLDPINASGPGDAAMAFVAEYASRSLRRESIAGCNVVAMGKVVYYGGRPGQKWSDQSIRKGIADVAPGQDAMPRYRILHRIMPSQFNVRRKDATTPDEKPDPSRPLGSFHVPSARGRIAENLVTRRPWYADLLEPPRWEQHSLKNQREDWKNWYNISISPQRLWLWNLQQKDQKDQLMALVQHDQMTDERERIFVEAFWDVLGAIYRREREAVKKQYNDGREITQDQMRAAAAHYRRHRKYDDSAAGRYLKRKANWNDRIGRMLAQAKTRTLLADRITELMRYAMNEYRSSTLAEHPDAIRRMLHDRYEWKRALHLARLALATYKPKNKR